MRDGYPMRRRTIPGTIGRLPVLASGRTAAVPAAGGKRTGGGTTGGPVNGR
jgi:hypothetical protein